MLTKGSAGPSHLLYQLSIPAHGPGAVESPPPWSGDSEAPGNGLSWPCAVKPAIPAPGALRTTYGGHANSCCWTPYYLNSDGLNPCPTLDWKGGPLSPTQRARRFVVTHLPAFHLSEIEPLFLKPKTQ